MDTVHQVSDAIRKGFGVLRQRADGGLRRLRAAVEARTHGAEAGDDEFQTLLADLHVQPPQPEGEPSADPLATQLRIANATIDELRTNLENLQPLGDLFAEAEKARLELLEELEESRATQPSPIADADLERAQKEIAKRDRRIAILEERADRWRNRWEERNEVASDRWRELVRVRKELRAARRSATR